MASAAHNVLDDESNNTNSNVKTGHSSTIIYILELAIILIAFYLYFTRNFAPECTDVGILQKILEFFFACCCHICYIAYSLAIGGCTGGSLLKGGFSRRR